MTAVLVGTLTAAAVMLASATSRRATTVRAGSSA